jgi:hypothetical protein
MRWNPSTVAPAALGLALLFGCGSPKRPPPLGDLGQSAGGSGSGGGSGGIEVDSGGPPAPDAGGLCGNQIIPTDVDRPNLYFVLDRSGSMADPLPGSPYNKYTNARIAMKDLLLAIGHRVNYGAAVFPAPNAGALGCNPGVEVFKTRPGDPVSYAQAGQVGPVLNGLLVTLANYSPDGGTPTAATLAALVPTLTALPGKTFVILATDGAPNCNAGLSCDASTCTLNIEDDSLDGQPCDATFNCCDPTHVQDGELDCEDGSATTLAVSLLAQSGIETYVIGMPGSEQYSTLLDQLATAGGTARSTSPSYYPVTNTTDLIDTLKQIGVHVAISCDIDLGQVPPDPNQVNVYFDKTLVPSSPSDGWTWTGPSSIELTGAACSELMSGDVLQVQIVAGCPTQVK